MYPIGLTFFVAFPLIVLVYWLLYSSLDINDVRVSVGLLFGVSILITLLFLIWLQLSWSGSGWGCTFLSPIEMVSFDPINSFFMILSLPIIESLFILLFYGLYKVTDMSS